MRIGYVKYYLESRSKIVSKYLPPLNVQHIPSSVGKNEKYCIHGSVRPNQLQSRTMSEQEGAVCFSIKGGLIMFASHMTICYYLFQNSK